MSLNLMAKLHPVVNNSKQNNGSGIIIVYDNNDENSQNEILS